MLQIVSTCWKASWTLLNVWLSQIVSSLKKTFPVLGLWNLFSPYISLWCPPRALLGEANRSDYDYEYEYDFWAREAWVLAVVDTVVAVVSSQQKYFSNFSEYEVITFCQSRECLVDKQHKMPQSRQNIARQVARDISQCIRTFKD